MAPENKLRKVKNSINMYKGRKTFRNYVEERLWVAKGWQIVEMVLSLANVVVFTWVGE
jgi:hypothetical protein